MFEDCLLESQVDVVSSRKRWTMLASLGLQLVVAGVFITLPLLHPEALPFRYETPKVSTPLMPKPPVRVRVEQVSSSGMTASSSSRPLIFSKFPGRDTTSSDAPALLPLGSVMTGTGSLPSGFDEGPGPVVTVAPPKSPAVPLHISSGVSDGMLLAPIRPLYPAIARATHIEGAVVVEAIISRTGSIENLHVVSGPLMLQAAAKDAIRQARYRPFRLNGEPTEVQTTITVNFRLGG
jgi:protein TonB